MSYPLVRPRQPQLGSGLDPTELLLRSAFRRALYASLLSTLAASCGGDGASSTPHTDADAGQGGAAGTPFASVACGEESLGDVIARDLSAASEVEYVELRSPYLTSPSPDSAGGRVEVNTWGRAGKMCKSAKDAFTCVNAVREVGLDVTSTSQLPSSLIIIATAGDDVRTATNSKELLDLIDGEVKSVADALAILSWTAYPVACDSEWSERETGFHVRFKELTNACEPYEESLITVQVSRAGEVDKISTEVTESDPEGCLVAGRRPEGFSPKRKAWRKQVSEYFAATAQLEHASIDAFETIARELCAYGAPEELVAQAQAAVTDEKRHTKHMSELAVAYGAELDLTESLSARAVRSLEAFAIDNAVEGCVRETFAALLATYQAAHAEAESVRTVLAEIAEDETRHASLAFQIARWVEPLLEAPARARLREAQRKAIDELSVDHAWVSSAELRRVAGFPQPHETRRWVSELEASLWS